MEINQGRFEEVQQALKKHGIEGVFTPEQEEGKYDLYQLFFAKYQSTPGERVSNITRRRF